MASVSWLTARRVSEGESSCGVGKLRMDAEKTSQFARFQFRRGVEEGEAGELRARESPHREWSDVVSSLIDHDRIDSVTCPLVRHRSTTVGDIPFRGWWVGRPTSFCKQN